MKTKFLIVGVMLLLACSKSVELPEGILDQPAITSVLIDFYVMEGRVTESRVKRDSAEQLFDYGMAKVLARHGLSDSLYRESLAYYLQHPKQLESIFEAVLDSLNLMKQQLKPDSAQTTTENDNKADSLGVGEGKN